INYSYSIDSSSHNSYRCYYSARIDTPAYFYSMGSGATVYIQGYNTVGVKGTGLYDTNKNKVMTGCKARLREGKRGWTAKLSKINNTLKTAYTTNSIILTVEE